MTAPQPHDNPHGEAFHTVLQALAALATVGEAAARLAAINAHNRATEAERQNAADQLAETAHDQAEQLTTRAHSAQRLADRQLMDRAFDQSWLASTDLRTTAVLWRTSAIYAMAGDPRADQALRRAYDHLAHLNPGLITAYDHHRSQGHNIADAMRAAAYDTWHHQTRHDGADTATLDLAVQDELARLALGVDPQVLDRLARQWRSGGHATAAEAAARLANAIRHGTDSYRATQADPRAPSEQMQRGPRRTTAPGVDETTPAATDQPGHPAAPTKSDQWPRSQPPPSAGRHTEQQQRMSRAFRPLGTVQPVLRSPRKTTTQPSSTRRKGHTR
jgi:hypothetical protein